MEITDIPRAAEIHTFARRKAYLGIVPNANLFIESTVLKRMEYFERALRQNDKEVYVYDDGIVKGILSVEFHEESEKPRTLSLRKIHVEPAMQGQGIGSMLMEHCEALAKRHNCARIHLTVLEQNTAARAFYEKSGFTIDGPARISRSLGVSVLDYIKEI